MPAKHTVDKVSGVAKLLVQLDEEPSVSIYFLCRISEYFFI